MELRFGEISFVYITVFQMENQVDADILINEVQDSAAATTV